GADQRGEKRSPRQCPARNRVTERDPENEEAGDPLDRRHAPRGKESQVIEIPVPVAERRIEERRDRDRRKQQQAQPRSPQRPDGLDIARDQIVDALLDLLSRIGHDSSSSSPSSRRSLLPALLDRSFAAPGAMPSRSAISRKLRPRQWCRR